MNCLINFLFFNAISCLLSAIEPIDGIRSSTRPADKNAVVCGVAGLIIHTSIWLRP